MTLADDLGNAAPKILDASTAHRVHPDWAYGFPEMQQGQAERIATSRKVANPGCYPTGAIGLIRPLVDAGMVPPDYPITINAVSGYSGGGRSMIEAPRARRRSGLRTLRAEARAQAPAGDAALLRPVAPADLCPFGRPLSAGDAGRRCRCISTRCRASPPAPTCTRYWRRVIAAATHVRVVAPPADGKLEPQGLNETNLLELTVHANETHRQAVLVARLDNLGKGASGAAVQNLRLMLGLPAARRATGEGGCLSRLPARVRSTRWTASLQRWRRTRSSLPPRR